jgi:hypothetical protein
MKRITSLALFALIVFSSCSYIGGKRVRGNGNVISQNRTVDHFNAVDVGGAIDVFLKQDSSRSVRVEVDENLQELIEVYEQNGVLHIEPKNNYNLDPSNDKIKVFVSAPQFHALDVSGASKITSENRITTTEAFDINISGASQVKLDIKAPRVEAEASGASEIWISGETKDFNVGGSGASTIKCFDLMAENTSVDISGACSAQVFASVKLDAHASGASGIKYRGAGTVSQDLSGASSISKAD